MSGPLDERLSRFTPDGTGIDRDALLFAAGRASVKPDRRWKSVAGLLALSQALTLLAFWPSSSPTVPTPVQPAPQARSIPPTPTPTPPPAVVERPRVDRWLPTSEVPSSAMIEDLMPDAPPQRAFTSALPEWLD